MVRCSIETSAISITCSMRSVRRGFPTDGQLVQRAVLAVWSAHGTFPTCSDWNAIAAIGPGAEVCRPLFRAGKGVVGGSRRFIAITLAPPLWS